ncbi:MAG: hypothetical protein H2184_12710 [Candidatus Galacturonibacter soehngenii]|nr:hypothetical protein [Candidatus Galacturonibacter soehngenii]
MENYSQEELDAAIQLISSIIINCEKMQTKFLEGTSQHSLLKNRIRALQIAKALIAKDSSIDLYTQLDIEKSLQPILSIIHKTKKAQMKYKDDTVQYKKMSPMISAMCISKAFIEAAIKKQHNK